ncbi:hypothetical protein ACJRO7_002495 [Eucalyptus globulus]|uniref:Dirigent protein n=1 Tax=Eucalyptus globulus TaxID=34317 RepID=A0ABD3LUK5_EUCGL
MARSLLKLILITLFFPLTIFAARSQTSARSLSFEAGPTRSEKLSRLLFYLHEPVGHIFGAVFVIDDILKLGPDAGSKLVGQAQGLTSSVSQSGSALLMAANFVFSECKNSLALEVREMAITGGTGDFQLARGYVRTKSHSIDQTNGLLVSE